MRERNRFFTWYHRVREGTMTREDFERRMPEVEREVGRLLRRAVVRAEKKTAGMAREILRWEKCLWTFVDVPGLEPTNNFGERCLRHAVMYRKTSFGTQGPEGSRFVERILTAVTTLKLQRRGVLDFLTNTLHARRLANHGAGPLDPRIAVQTGFPSGQAVCLGRRYFVGDHGWPAAPVPVEQRGVRPGVDRGPDVLLRGDGVVARVD
jgi:hypothetical protein